MIDVISTWKHSLMTVAHREKIATLSSFFKTGKGQYGEGDRFLGIYVPDNRRISVRYASQPLATIGIMLSSPEHEFRLAALIALVKKFGNGTNEKQSKDIVDFYLKHAKYINNWDLVDLSAPQILGQYQLLYSTLPVLEPLSTSSDLWKRRMAIVATTTLIRAGQYELTKSISAKYLSHPEDLIHKATGWMLREMGKRDEPELIRFLDEYAAAMPRTALRYAIERLPPEMRKHYLSKH